MLEILKRYWKWLAGGGSVTVLTILDTLYEWGALTSIWGLIKGLVKEVFDDPVPSALFFLSLGMVVLWHRHLKLANVVAIRFKDNFKKDLRRNWDFTGDWQVVHGNELLVTQSEIGGITKVGQLWTDYRFEFDAIIVNDRIGWIVRAQDLFNYYMVQLTSTDVRPHLRFGGQWILLGDRPHNQQVPVNKWVNVQTDVRGAEIRIRIDKHDVYYNNEFFSTKFIRLAQPQEGTPSPQVVPIQPNSVVVPAFTTGRVGFRMFGAEQGRIRRVSVKPL